MRSQKSPRVNGPRKSGHPRKRRWDFCVRYGQSRPIGVPGPEGVRGAPPGIDPGTSGSRVVCGPVRPFVLRAVRRGTGPVVGRRSSSGSGISISSCPRDPSPRSRCLGGVRGVPWRAAVGAALGPEGPHPLHHGPLAPWCREHQVRPERRACLSFGHARSGRARSRRTRARRPARQHRPRRASPRGRCSSPRQGDGCAC